MERDIEIDLLHWKQQAEHMPILLRGARQVGKSYVIEKFGLKHFENLVVINFELHPEFGACFETLDPADILKQISLLTRKTITPGKTLLFLDEIQDCPNAIRSLRYFKELLPELHVIGAGSLLEFTLNDAEFRMPVGRVMSLYLKPLSFKEFLMAAGYGSLREEIEHADLSKPLAESLHQLLLKQVRTYMSLGGMPAVINAYLAPEKISPGAISRQYDYEQSRIQMAILLSNYRQDFGKYAKHTQIKYLQTAFEKVPGMVGDQCKYAKINPDARAQNVKDALELLSYAGLIYYVYSTSASGIPLITLMNEKKFKVIFLDIGLMVYANRIESELVLDDIILLNRGAIAEQFVGQELLAYAPAYEEAKLFFWNRDKKSSLAEVDFITTVGSKIIPIEVKSGSTGTLKSLHLLMAENKLKLGVRFSQQALSYDGKLLSLPFYMVGELTRLVNSFKDK